MTMRRLAEPSIGEGVNTTRHPMTPMKRVKVSCEC